MNVVYTNSEEETVAWAAAWAEMLGAGCFVAVDGELGAGKTAFARGIAQGLGVAEQVVSPTFTLLRVYDSGRSPLYHFDVYRVRGVGELEDIGFFDCAEGDGVCVCEWASRIADELPANRTDVLIERTGEHTRKIIWSNTGDMACIAGE